MMDWAYLRYMWIPEETWRRYLLGKLRRHVKKRLEKAYSASPRLHARLKMVEEDLVTSYVQGHLSEADRREFESHYLNSHRRHIRVERARLLADAQFDVMPERSPSLRVRAFNHPWVSVAALLLLVCLASLTRYWKANRILIVRLESPAMQVRSQGNNAVPKRIPWITKIVRLEVETSHRPAPAYAIALSQAGRVIWTGQPTRIEHHTVELDIPTSILSTADYQLKVEGLSGTRQSISLEEFRFELRIRD